MPLAPNFGGAAAAAMLTPAGKVAAKFGSGGLSRGCVLAANPRRRVLLHLLKTQLKFRRVPSRLFYVATTIAACALNPNDHFCVPICRSCSSDKNSAKAKMARRAERKLAGQKRVKQALKAQKCAINAVMGKKPRKGSKAHGREVAMRLERQSAPVSDEHIVVDVRCGSCNAMNCSDLACALNDSQTNYTGNTSGTVPTVQRAKDICISAATVVIMLARRWAIKSPKYLSSTRALRPCTRSPSRKSLPTSSCSTGVGTRRTWKSRRSRSNSTIFPLKIIARQGEVGRCPGARGREFKTFQQRS